MIRVGFVMAYSDQNWMGGINYLSNLLHSVMQMPDREIEPVLILPSGIPEKIIAGFPKVEMIYTALVDYKSKFRLARKIVTKALFRDVLLESFLKRHKIDVLSHSDHLGLFSKVPTICWIPDFQHRRLPDFFSAKELAGRDRGYREIAKYCSTLVLSSCDAQTDLNNFIPEAFSKSKVLNFVSGMGTGVKSTKLDVLKERYGITLPYLHLPNQFWAHKNHGIVIEALGILKSRGKPVLLLSTGHTKDVRRPEYFLKLQSRIDQLGVADCFKILGLVPYEDMSGLMTNSAAVINPSLFEGWSTTVEESKSLGKTIILSDIPVHREQSPEHGLYFDPKNADQLADAIEAALTQWEPAGDQARLVKAQNSLSRRFSDFGRRYQDIVLQTPGVHV